MEDIKEIRKITLNYLLSIDSVKKAYEDIYEEMVKTAKIGSLNKLIYRDNYDEVTFALLLRVLSLKGFDLKYYRTTETQDFKDIDVVNIYWGGSNNGAN